MKAKPELMSAALVLVMLQIGLGATRTSPAKAPHVGIDTTFGDRYHEAADAFQHERWQETISKTNAALAMKPDNRNGAILLFWRGYAYESLSQHERALADYDESIRRDPTPLPYQSLTGP